MMGASILFSRGLCINWSRKILFPRLFDLSSCLLKSRDAQTVRLICVAQLVFDYENDIIASDVR